MGKADIHIHSVYSDGTCTVTAALEWAASFTDLDVIAIADHDVLDGAEEAMALAPHYGIEVIPGCEITTRDGHLLALNMHTPIPRGLSMLESVLRVAEQGGICIPAHPTNHLAHGASRETIQSLLQDADARLALIGLEAFNAGILSQRSNRNASSLAQEFGLAPTGGSDSHVIWTIGMGYTEFEGKTASDFLRAMHNRTTTAQHNLCFRSPIYWSRHLLSFMLRRAGWVTWTPEPNASFALRRVTDLQASEYLT